MSHPISELARLYTRDEETNAIVTMILPAVANSRTSELLDCALADAEDRIGRREPVATGQTPDIGEQQWQ